MPSYVIESYLADRAGAVEESRKRARAVADERGGVRYLRTTFLPDDETILRVFEAPSRGALQRAAQRECLQCERIVEAVESSASETPRIVEEKEARE